MSTLDNVKTTVAGWLLGVENKGSAAIDSLKHSSFWSIRTFLAIGVIVLAVIAERVLLTDYRLGVLAQVAIALIWANTVSKVAFGFYNVWLANTAKKVDGPAKAAAPVTIVSAADVSAK